MKRILLIGVVTGMLVAPAGIARAGGGFCHEPTQTERTVTDVVYRVQIDYKDVCATPNLLHVETGQMVVWRNTDPMAHTVTSTSGGWADFRIMENQTFSHKFTEPGIFAYYCRIHPNMGGIVDVGSARPLAATAKRSTSSSGAGLAGLSGVAGLLGGAALGLTFRRKQNGSHGKQS